MAEREDWRRPHASRHIGVAAAAPEEMECKERWIRSGPSLQPGSNVRGSIASQ